MQTARDAYSSCGRARVSILFNMQVVSVDLEKPAVHLKDGTVMEADGKRASYEPFMCNTSESCRRDPIRHPRRRRW
jgi:hypothetical protein